jgi:Histidine kinase-, DNA gyrase B-, and HSP90-like ATPase
MSQEYETHGYGGQRNLSQSYAAPGYSSQGYSPKGDFPAGISQGYAEAPGQQGQQSTQDYGTQGTAARSYGARDDSAPVRDAAEYRGLDYGAPGRGPAGYGSREYAAPGGGPAGYAGREYGRPGGGSAGYASREYGAPGRGSAEYGGREYGEPGRGTPEYRIPDYSAAGRVSAEFRRPDYSAPARDAGEFRGPDYSAPPRDAREYRDREYDDPARGTAEYRLPDYSAPARGAAEYRGQEFGDPARGTAAYRFQEHRDPFRGEPQDRSQQYGAAGYGPQSYPARSHQNPASAQQGQRQPYGYAAPSYTSPGQAGPGPSAGRSMQDSGQPGLTGIAAPGAAAATSWDAGATVAGPAAPPVAAGMTASAGAAGPAAEPSAQPLYGVLGGLALRDLTLVESLLELVEQLESREEDPQQLDSLFRVDHLATRMRRNSENLLVLAGQDRESQDFDPVQLLDVARAAVSEIADYDRAQVAPLPSVQVLGVAADDVTHILAELLDNAMSKSPESAEVVIRAERTGDGTLVVSVEDSGIGIPIDRLNEINARLSRSPVVDVAVTRHMGLYVVGRLAHRHGIRVQLRERPYGGIVASVIIPSQLVRADPDAPREIMPAETAGRFQALGGAGLSTPQLSIEARGADGLRAQRPGAVQPGMGVSGLREAVEPPAAPAARRPGGAPGARSGIGWPVSARQEADRERPGPAPAAGYPDAVPVPRFEPADPAELPKRKPGALSAANGIPAPLERGDKVAVSAGDKPALESEAERIRDEFSEFQLGQRTARSEASGPASPESGDQQDGPGAGIDAGSDTGEPAGGAPAEAGDNDGA